MMTPGTHETVLGGVSDALAARRRGLELRDTVLVMGPGERVQTAFLFRVPLDGTVAHNVMTHGSGALHIEACRVATGDNLNGGAYCGTGERDTLFGIGRADREFSQPVGRWPPNLLLIHGIGCALAGTHNTRRNVRVGEIRPSVAVNVFGDGLNGKSTTSVGESVPAWACQPGCLVSALDGLTGEHKVGGPGTTRKNDASNVYSGPASSQDRATVGYADAGSVSRFYPQFKDSQGMLAWLGVLTARP